MTEVWIKWGDLDRDEREDLSYLQLMDETLPAFRAKNYVKRGTRTQIDLDSDLEGRRGVNIVVGKYGEMHWFMTRGELERGRRSCWVLTDLG